MLRRRRELKGSPAACPEVAQSALKAFARAQRVDVRASIVGSRRSSTQRLGRVTQFPASRAGASRVRAHLPVLRPAFAPRRKPVDASRPARASRVFRDVRDHRARPTRPNPTCGSRSIACAPANSASHGLPSISRPTASPLRWASSAGELRARNVLAHLIAQPDQRRQPRHRSGHRSRARSARSQCRRRSVRARCRARLIQQQDERAESQAARNDTRGGQADRAGGRQGPGDHDGRSRRG